MRAITALVAVALVTAGAATPPAASRFEYLFSPDHVRNDTQHFLHLAVADSGYSRAVLEPALPRLRSLERDLPVVLLLGRASGRSVDDITGLRAQGLGWPAVMSRVNVAPDVLFAGIDRDPGPPYGKAWGYWKKRDLHGHLSDNDVAGLAHVQLGSRWLSTSAYDLAHNHGSRKQVVKQVVDKKGRPYAHHGGAQSGKPQKSKGKGSGY